jgi:hypothetical protein
VTGRVRGRILPILGLGILVLVPVVASAATVRLPSRADLHPASNLPPIPGTFPNKIPLRNGSIADDEHVMVGVDGKGSVRSVVVDQTIRIGGVGDYTLEIAGPALNVVALPGSDSTPGLRNGSVIWEGFCPGSRTLRARITIDTTSFRFAPLPIEIARAGDRVRLTNRTAAPEQVASGRAEAGALARALSATRAALRARRTPEPGKGGIPSSLEGTEITFHSVPIVVPLRARGSIGSTLVDTAVDSSVEIAAPRSGAINLSVAAQLPSPAAVGSTFGTLQRALWQSARVSGQGYLGIPFDGPVHATYTFHSVGLARAVTPKRAPVEHPHPVAIAIASALFLGVVAAGRRWWTTH